MIERIKEIRERMDKATEGPWVYRGPTFGCDDAFVQATIPGLNVCSFHKEANGHFIAHAREDINWLLDLLQPAEQEQT